MISPRIIAFILSAPTVAAFLFGPTPTTMTQNPDVMRYTDAQTGTLLNIRLDVGDKNAVSRMNVNGILLSLVNDRATYSHPKMPGADGPNPQLSSGPRKLDLLQSGYTVDITGCKEVQMVSGCWELNWKSGAPAGSLVCGFYLPHTVRRNDASLREGRLYLSFPVWTKDGLEHAQKEKERVLTKAQLCLDEKNQELAKIHTKTNPVMKAIYYRNAARAAEKYSLMAVEKVKVVPSDDEVIPIQDGLLLTTGGLVWDKQESSSFKAGHHQLLGTAHVSAGKHND